MSKKSRNIIVAIVCVVILLSAFYVSSKSSLVRQLQGPIEGTENVFTLNDRLFVVSKGNHIYIWQWDDLSAWPVVAKPQTTAITPVAEDKIVYYSSSGLNKLILTDLKADKELGSLSLGYGAECKKIKTSSNGKFGIASMVFIQGMQKDWFKLALFDYDFKKLSSVFQKNTVAEDFLLYDFTITNDGNFLAGSGQKISDTFQSKAEYIEHCNKPKRQNSCC